MIPLCEPSIEGRELQYVSDCLNTGWVSSAGEYVRRFEAALEDYIGVAHAVACDSGTSAIHVALLLSDVGPGDEVIVPTVTFIAPVNAVRYVAASPVFVDCDEYCNLDVAAVRRFLERECTMRSGRAVNKATGRIVSAVIPVHVFGTPVDMDLLAELALEFGLKVVEDASESLGSTYKGRQCGSLGELGCLSFNGNKIVTTGGGGAILTNDEDVARRARYLTTQAKEPGVEYIHRNVGYNYRMNNILAAVGLAQLETMDSRLARKRGNFERYVVALDPDRKGFFLGQPSWSDSNFWFYGYLCRDAAAKTRVIEACTAADIQVRPLWYPNHLQEPYRGMQAYEITRALEMYDRVVNIPCSVTLTADQIESVATLIRETDDR